jgi:hypothetical protein
MSIVRTDLRTLRESAREIRFFPVPPITATNVQDAILQANTISPSITPTIIGSVNSPYSVTPFDQILLVDTSTGPVQINMLPQSSRAGLDLEIKDASGNAAANPISVVMSGAETADGLNPYLIDSNFGGYTFKPKGAAGYFVRN